jgi:mono/diheme cytochrome c family protein
MRSDFGNVCDDPPFGREWARSSAMMTTLTVRGATIVLCALSLSLLLLGERAALAQSQLLSKGWRFDEKGGEALYMRICAACHQRDGKGAVGAAAYPALAGDADLASAAYVEGVLLNGLRGMPPLGRLMSDEQVADVVNYVRSHFGNAYDDALSAADVRAARP